MPLLQVRGLEKWYGRRQVVSGVDYDVERGEVVGLLGPNGAGKTTSFRMTIGLIDADGGIGPLRRPRRHQAADVPARPGRHGLPRARHQRLPPAFGRRQLDGDPGNPAAT